ncbi:hypothetical protein HDU93_006541 [Gonapodya sp. JEL0774]|nr:hypothetical protein HDU93_006541 [Gonapodya sp. JEL0774]
MQPESMRTFEFGSHVPRSSRASFQAQPPVELTDQLAAVLASSNGQIGSQKTPKFGTDFPGSVRVSDQAEMALGSSLRNSNNFEETRKTPKFGTNVPSAVATRNSIQIQALVGSSNRDSTVLEATLEELRNIETPVVANVSEEVVLSPLDNPIKRANKITSGSSHPDLGTSNSMSNLVTHENLEPSILTALDVQRAEKARDAIRKRQRSKLEDKRRRRMMFMGVFLAIAIVIIAAVTAFLLMGFFRQS